MICQSWQSGYRDRSVLVQLCDLGDAVGSANPLTVSIFETGIFVFDAFSLDSIPILVTNDVLAFHWVDRCINWRRIIDAQRTPRRINSDGIRERFADLKAEKPHADFQRGRTCAVRERVVAFINF